MTRSWGDAADGMLFERNDRLVLEAFGRGEFDYVEGVQEVSEADFFRVICQRKVLDKLAQTYPSPRQKHDVPVWVYIASDISMRFHAEHQFHGFTYIVRTGGMISAFGPQMGHKAVDPETGDVSLRCEGFNNKNAYDRQTPCDQDYVRKMARDTKAESLQTWFNKEVVGIFKQHHAFDSEGLFIGDATYLFVPDNPKYEGSSWLLFDEEGHPVDPEKVSAKEKKTYQWRRCYKLVSLIHTNRAAEFFLYAGLRVVSGNAHENPLLYAMVKAFVTFHGRGIIKRLIVDRGFLDGEEIGHCKKELGVDVLIPVRRNMDVYKDVVGMAEGGLLKFNPWQPELRALKPIPIHRPEHIRKREAARQKTLAQRKPNAAKAGAKAPLVEPKRRSSELAVVENLETYSACPVPLHALVNRETYDDRHAEYWVLLDTARITDPKRVRQDYALRVTIEERHRQLKCFSDLEAFSSRAFSLVVNQVVFVLLTYSLLQWFLLRQGRKDLNRKTPTRISELLRPTITVILIYYQSYVAHLSPLEHQELVLTLKPHARKKILAKTRRLRRRLVHQLDKARPP